MHVSDLGDHIGMESCVDLETDTQPPAALTGNSTLNRKNTNRRSVSVRKCNKELPPPLPIQSSTVMKRYYTDDGRLVITEEKIQSSKFHFTARRSHGRLTIQLVNSGDSTCCDSVSDNECDFSLCDNQIEEDDNKEVVKVDENSDESEVAVVSGGGDEAAVISGGGGVEKCNKYNAAVRVAATGPCLFVNRNQLHAIRPVHI